MSLSNPLPPAPASPPAKQWLGVRRSSLRFAVLIALVVGLLLPTAAVLVYDGQKTRRAVMEDLQRDLSHTLAIMSLSLAEPVWQVAPELALPMVNAQVEDPRFVAVTVVDPHATQPFLVYERKHEATEDELTLTDSRPIRRDGREIARLKISMSALPLLRAKQEEQFWALMRSSVVLVLSAGLILWVMQVLVLRPTARLTHDAELLAAGRLDQPLAVSGGADELTRVASAMERMRLALLSAFEALRRQNLSLEATVAQRTSELTLSNDELSRALATLKTAQRELVESEKLASLGRLVAGMAHELNTPLGNALTVVTALEDRYKELERMLNGGGSLRRSVLEDLVRDSRHGQDILHRNVQKAADLVRDFKQVAIDQTTDQRREFDLAQVIEDVLLMVEPRFKHTPFLINTELEPGLHMDSFPGSLGQVLTNLLMNTLVHAFDGREHGTVRVQCRSISSLEVELQVIDDGKGMDENVRRRIFDPFFTTKLGTGGSGLGMHIVHNIVTNVLGGVIDVRSSPGEGTSTTIRLPSVAPYRTASHRPEAV